MKELTEKEKARRYDEVVNEVKNLRDMLLKEGVINKDGVICDNFNRIFPELKEDEDEKVEKAIFGMVYDSDNELWSSYDVTKSDVLDWLEKQGKQKDILEDVILDSNEDGLIAETIRYKNEKSANKVEPKHTPKHKVGDTIYYNSVGKVKSMIVANVVTDSTDNPMYEDENGSVVFEKDLIEQNSIWSEDKVK